MNSGLVISNNLMQFARPTSNVRFLILEAASTEVFSGKSFHLRGEV